MMRKWWQKDRGKRIAVIGLLGLLGAFAVLIWVGSAALAQPGARQGPRGGLRALMFLEQSWAAVTFEIKASPEQLKQLYPTYQAAWDQRKEAFKEARESRDRQAFREAMEKVQADLTAKLQEVLNDQQEAELKQWQEAQPWMGGRRPTR